MGGFRQTARTIDRAPAQAEAAPSGGRNRLGRLHDSLGNRGVQQLLRALSGGALQRKCGTGCGCEECALQKKVKVGPAGDAHEREADALADRMVAGASVAPGEHGAPSARPKRAREGGAESAGLDGLGAGQALPASVQEEFGPKLGHHLDGVRVHTGAAADAAAQAVGARAFTLGRDLVFAAGEYAPGSGEGRRLLAHELVHWVQQGGRADRIQRTLKIDAAASDDPTTAIAELTPLLTQICPTATVDATSGLVSEPACANPTTVAGGAHPVGCCCICNLSHHHTNHLWRIISSNTDAPTTNSGTRVVRMTRVGVANAPELRYWTAAGTVASQPPVEALGHELCGHASLMEIGAHPSSLASTPDRAFSDIHDPTVKVQNTLATELGLPGPRRGLAASGVHRGESLRVFTIGPYPVGDDDPAPFTTQISDAIAFANGNSDLFVDVVGFRDGADAAGLSTSRATRVQALVAAGVAPPTTSIQMTPGAAASTLTRVQPATDGGASGSRVVELAMAIRPAGLIAPIGPAPPSPPTHVPPEHPFWTGQLIGPGAAPGSNACLRLLARTGWL